MIDDIFPDCITLFEELLHDADDSQDLHLILWSLGGDGETAIRLVRSAQARCRELTVIVPDMAKSAATLLVMGAHHILMGQRATSDQSILSYASAPARARYALPLQRRSTQRWKAR